MPAAAAPDGRLKSLLASVFPQPASQWRIEKGNQSISKEDSNRIEACLVISLVPEPMIYDPELEPTLFIK